VNFVIRGTGGREGMSQSPHPSTEVNVNKPLCHISNAICNQNIIHKLLHESITEMPIEVSGAPCYCLLAVHRPRDDHKSRVGGVKLGAGISGYGGDDRLF
jgi:hypothetical protein